jgi:hypothetical protein
LAELRGAKSGVGPRSERDITEILDVCICIQKSICNRSFPARENIDEAKAKAANCKDILGKKAFVIAGI